MNTIIFIVLLMGLTYLVATLCLATIVFISAYYRTKDVIKAMGMTKDAMKLSYEDFRKKYKNDSDFIGKEMKV